jgi:hypothetical protein
LFLNDCGLLPFTCEI